MFKAILLTRDDAKRTVATLTDLDEAQLPAGDVDVRVEYSTLNYKDALAITNASPVVRSWPMVAGIDGAGTVLDSTHPAWQAGDRVVLNGFGVGESHNGGYAQKARVKGEWLVKLPDAISTEHAMAIGTAGYTAMLCVLGLERLGVTPEKGEVLVTGAAGGVGSVAIALLSRLGFRVVASSRRKDSEGAYLIGLGAAEVVDAADFQGPARPLARERWAGAVDAVGSHTLANVLSQTRYGGVVTACGLAQGMDLPGSVAPFILRGITLAGVDSVMRPKPDRIEAWGRLARDLDLAKLDAMTSRAKLDDLPRLGAEIVEGKVRGRVVVDVNA